MKHDSENLALVGNEQIRIRGIVQGVGFRPTVYRLATERGLAGEVLNDAEGVLVRIRGTEQQITDFLDTLKAESPPLSRIDAIERNNYPHTIEDGFLIVTSRRGQIHTAIAPDAATCPACLAEITDPADRRYRYPFTNCTHCGPRLSIVVRIPYDRANTSMSAFSLCPSCALEYADPSDRRFHAQPNACPDCGPSLVLRHADGSTATANALQVAAEALRRGKILAIKGLSGFHLACDATNAEAVACLRARKYRYDKPFALMARDIQTIKHYCDVGTVEHALLTSSAAPIVLLAINEPDALPASVAPSQTCYGFMLPYTPLHSLLMDELDDPIVLTSGNRSDEPQCIGNSEACEKLDRIADAWLLHNRDIVNRLDDSVVRVVAGSPRLLRRARGYAPAPLPLPEGFEGGPPVLAFGGELKNTFCLLRNGEAILSQHMGDLEHASAYATFQETIELYLKLYDHKPSVLAVDLHPEYLSTKLGKQWETNGSHRIIKVQHHHAHIAACLAENNVSPNAPPVLGIALDGLGFGSDGTLWGGEFLLADYCGFERLGLFNTVPMPGGTQAIFEPWRMAFAYLRQDLDWASISQQYSSLDFFRHASENNLDTLAKMMDKKINSPLTSSCGRLFDAVSAIMGLRQEISYEGQAAIELENTLDMNASESEIKGYSFSIKKSCGNEPAVIQTGSLWQALLGDLAEGCPHSVISARFHHGLVDIIMAMIEHLTEHYDNPWENRVALSGGVFQNVFLSKALEQRLETSGYQVFTHHNVPPNDGGLALGQAAIATAISIKDP